MLGDDDHAPFVVNGEIITEEQAWEGSSIPESFIVYNQNTGQGANAELQAHGILRGEGIIEAPDRFGIGNYLDVSNPSWEPSNSVGDSGYSIWWNERTVGNGQSFTVNTFYGLAVPPTIEDPTLANEAIIGQAATAMLAQANMAPQNVLQLLQ